MTDVQRTPAYQAAQKAYHTRELFVALTKVEADTIEACLQLQLPKPRRWREAEWAMTLSSAKETYEKISDQQLVTAFDLSVLLGHLARCYRLLSQDEMIWWTDRALENVLTTFTRLRGVIHAEKDLVEFIDVCRKEERAKKRASRAIRKAKKVIAKAQRRLK